MHFFKNWKAGLVKVASIVFLMLLTLVLAAGLSDLLSRAGVAASAAHLLLMALIATILAVPAGTALGVVLEEYFAPHKPVKTLPEALLNFSALPAILYALMAIVLITGLFGLDDGLLPGALTLTVCIAPVMIASTRKAIRAVPRDMHTAALALGASRWQRIWFLIIPYSMTAIISGVMRSLALGMGLAGPLLLLGALLSRMPHAVPAADTRFIPAYITEAVRNVIQLPARGASNLNAAGLPASSTLVSEGGKVASHNASVVLFMLASSVLLNLAAIRLIRRSTLKRTIYKLSD